jgi:chromosomal replication initiation ATPase DnaA
MRSQDCAASAPQTIESISLRSRPRELCERAAGAVSVLLQVPLRDIMGRTRIGRVCRARQLAMYVSNVVCGVGMSACARAFGRDRSTVSYACHRIEDEHDDPGFDQRLDALERLIRDEGCL